MNDTPYDHFSIGADAEGNIDDLVISAYDASGNEVATSFQSLVFEEGSYTGFGGTDLSQRSAHS